MKIIFFVCLISIFIFGCNKSNLNPKINIECIENQKMIIDVLFKEPNKMADGSGTYNIYIIKCIEDIE